MPIQVSFCHPGKFLPALTEARKCAETLEPGKNVRPLPRRCVYSSTELDDLGRALSIKRHTSSRKSTINKFFQGQFSHRTLTKIEAILGSSFQGGERYLFQLLRLFFYGAYRPKRHHR